MKNVNTYSSEAFREAYETHSDAIFRYCLFRVTDRETAVDITQETFVKTWDYLHNGGVVKNIRAFLYTTAGHLIIDLYRKRKPSDSLDRLYDDLGFEPSVEADSLEERATQLDGEQAVELLRAIPESYGHALFMRYVQELSISEIAEVTGESENTIAVRLHRGLLKLKTIFNHESDSSKSQSMHTNKDGRKKSKNN